MGRSITPTYRAELDLVKLATGARFTQTICWHGRATAARCDEYAETFHQSTLPGGCNEHLGVELVRGIRVIRQSTGEVVATTTPKPMFEVA